MLNFGQAYGNVPDYRGSGPGVPSLKPYYKHIHVDPDQRIWVEHSTRSVRVEPNSSDQKPYWVEPPSFDVFSATGQYLGQVRFPNTFALHYVRGSEVWGPERDDLDVQYVVKYRLMIDQRRVMR